MLCENVRRAESVELGLREMSRALTCADWKRDASHNLRGGSRRRRGARRGDSDRARGAGEDRRSGGRARWMVRAHDFSGADRGDAAGCDFPLTRIYITAAIRRRTSTRQTPPRTVQVVSTRHPRRRRDPSPGQRRSVRAVPLARAPGRRGRARTRLRRSCGHYGVSCPSSSAGSLGDGALALLESRSRAAHGTDILSGGVWWTREAEARGSWEKGRLAAR